MASTIGIVLILLGGFVMAIGYGMVSDCLSTRGYDPCWSPFGRGSAAFGFYSGAIITMIGVVVLVGGDFVKLLKRLKGVGPDYKQQFVGSLGLGGSAPYGFQRIGPGCGRASVRQSTRAEVERTMGSVTTKNYIDLRT